MTTHVLESLIDEAFERRSEITLRRFCFNISYFFGNEFCKSLAALLAPSAALLAVSVSAFCTCAITSLMACCCSGVNLAFAANFCRSATAPE